MRTQEISPILNSTPFNLNAGDRALVIDAHPDDESVFHGKAINHLVESGALVYSVTASDGERSTKGDQTFVKSGQRRGEARAAFAVLGVAEERQYYFGLPDGGLAKPGPKGQLV